MYMKERKYLNALHVKQVNEIAELAKAQKKRAEFDRETAQLQALRSQREKQLAKKRKNISSEVRMKDLFSVARRNKSGEREGSARGDQKGKQIRGNPAKHRVPQNNWGKNVVWFAAKKWGTRQKEKERGRWKIWDNSQGRKGCVTGLDYRGQNGNGGETKNGVRRKGETKISIKKGSSSAQIWSDWEVEGNFSGRHIVHSWNKCNKVIKRGRP